MTLKFTAFSLIAIALAGCAGGPIPQPDLPDSLTAYVNNDSTGMLLMRGAVMHTYANTRCEGEQRRSFRLMVANEEALTTIPVKDGVPLTFTLTALNSHSFRGNWGCSVTSTITPVGGLRYEAVLQAERDNSICEVTIRDQDRNVVPLTAPAPDYSCDPTGGFVKNGGRAQPDGYHVPVSVSVRR